MVCIVECKLRLEIEFGSRGYVLMVFFIHSRTIFRKNKIF
jgi:hypothetical protein